MRASVAILGGGYAGMAAAVTLAGAGIPVTVFEAARRLGGRARRVDWNGVALDNGLHILVGAYRETLRLIRLVNPAAGEALHIMPLDWRIHRRFRLRVPALPAPLHVLAGMLLMRGAQAGERLAAIRFVRRMRSAGFSLPRDTTVERLLAEHGQRGAIVRHLWHPLCVAALNTPPAQASAQVLLNVLRDTLDAPACASRFVLARCDLSALFPEPAAAYVRARGGEIRLGQAADAVAPVNGGFAVQARGARFQCSHVICALPPHRLPRLICGLPMLEEPAAAVQRFRYQPIHSVYLQYPGPVRLPAPMLGLAGGLAQWAFDREAICGQRGLIGVVISAEGAHEELAQDELARRIHAELAECLGPLPQPMWQRVIAEKRATFACTPDMQRPAQRTALPNFFLAGDYTASDYPATLEAAVRSGIVCARGVIAAVRAA